MEELIISFFPDLLFFCVSPVAVGLTRGLLGAWVGGGDATSLCPSQLVPANSSHLQDPWLWPAPAEEHMWLGRHGCRCVADMGRGGMGQMGGGNGAGHRAGGPLLEGGGSPEPGCYSCWVTLRDRGCGLPTAG